MGHVNKDKAKRKTNKDYPGSDKKKQSESKSSEEPTILASIVTLLKFRLDDGAGFCPGLRTFLIGTWRREGGDIDIGFDGIRKIERITRGHEMIVIDHFDEGSDF